MNGELGRRTFLKAAGGLGLLALVPPVRLEGLLATAPAPGAGGRYLTAHELATLRAVTSRFVPGPPDDPDPGALDAGAAEAIDLYLAAFTFTPPLIHAGGPFSDRAGATHDDFADFVPLDAQAELGWRIRIEGSQGLAAREFAGPVTGLQQLYRDGLAHLDDRARSSAGSDFADLPGPAQDAILADQTDDDVQSFVDVALGDTIHAVYGPPEYGGNRGLVGWTTVPDWPGDVQPRGYTPAQVSQPDAGAVPPLDAATARAALARFLPALAGVPAPRDRWWRGRAGYERG